MAPSPGLPRRTCSWRVDPRQTLRVDIFHAPLRTTSPRGSPPRRLGGASVPGPGTELVRPVAGVPIAAGVSTARDVLEGRTLDEPDPVRGVGFAAAAIAVTSLAWGRTRAPDGGHARMTNPVTSSLSAAVARHSSTCRETEGTSAEEVARLHACAAARRACRATSRRRGALHAGAHGGSSRSSAARSRRRTSAVRRGAHRRSRLGARARRRRWLPRAAGPASSSPAWTRCGRGRATGACGAYNPGSGAYGIPRPSRAPKMALGRTVLAAPVPRTQIAWGLAYIARTYGTPCFGLELLAGPPLVLRRAGHSCGRAIRRTSSASSSCSWVMRPALTCPRSTTTSRIVRRSATDCLTTAATSS